MSTLDSKQFLIMGIVNVTPDSFYDGGRYSQIDAAVAHGLRLAQEGADILDIGGASSRPGASIVDPEEECSRVVPVIEKLARDFKGPISVDTTWSLTARAALKAGASWVNDISAARFDPQIANVVAELGATVVLMHSRKTPQTMQHAPSYDDVIKEVSGELLEAVSKFRAAGVGRERIILDPGIGFAKTFDHNIALLRGLERLKELGFPLLVGTSRKAFIGKITERETEQRLWGSLGSVASAYTRGARIFRVHDVKETLDFLKVFSTIENV
ncbi:dihydropteroate synthase [Chitinispirillales bacterium ANBcel5]|uniref:dihydropteroate synthase n=1 Tax=Cellulosispirillum alkaliphilum TaxID=3039283 RepID=UPI002A4E820B|nr:dihydropteroate synthase [Chitinispirillales bacterium ANBcel5]